MDFEIHIADNADETARQVIRNFLVTYNYEALLDDAIGLDRQARTCGVDSSLEIWNDMIHVWHAFYPI